jgi:hypothetical protein
MIKVIVIKGKVCVIIKLVQVMTVRIMELTRIDSFIVMAIMAFMLVFIFLVDISK